MDILSWLVVGLVAGWLASAAMGSGYGLIGDIIIGVVGALIGGWLGSRLLNRGDLVTGINLTTIVTAFVGSVILIGALRLLRGARV